MNTLTGVTNAQQAQQTQSKASNSPKKTEVDSDQVTEAAVYEPNAKEEKEVTYNVDLEKVKAMKEETDRRMVQLFKESINSGFLKQVGGLKGVLEKILNGEEVEGLDIEVTEESIAQAKEDVAEGGYWSPEKTSDRFIDFAKALSGGDKSKAGLLIDAFKEGYAMAEEMWGGELPEISQKTYDMTLDKFDAWENETDEENDTVTTE